MKRGVSASWAVVLVALAVLTMPAAAAVAESSAAASVCDRAQFIGDVTVPDGTTLPTQAAFTKTWRLKNIGTCTWTTSYGLVFDGGDRMGAPDTAKLPTDVAPGNTVDLTVNLSAPSLAGAYRGYWKLQNASGARFGNGADSSKSWWVDIRVTGPAPGPSTPSPAPAPDSATRYDFAANACAAVWSSDAGKLPCPGSEGDQKGFVLKLPNPQLENGLVEARQGLLTFPQNTHNGYVLGIYPPYRVKPGDRFKSVVSCAYAASSCYVVFQLDYQTGTGPITPYWAFIEKYEGQSYQAELDLSRLVGQDVKFILHVLSVGSPTGDRALWVAPVIYNPSSADSSIVRPLATPTARSRISGPTSTPTVAAGGSNAWTMYENAEYRFSFRIPPGSSIATQSDNGGRVYLPLTGRTNLVQKYIDVTVVEKAAQCQSPAPGARASSEKVTINGIPFLRETGVEGAAGQVYSWTGYSSAKGDDCITLMFVLQSTNAGNYPVAPPIFDPAVESAVFSTVMSTFASQ